MGEGAENNGLLTQKLDWVGGLVSELKELVTKLDLRLQEHERDEVRYQTRNTADIADIGRQLAEQKTETGRLIGRLDAVEKAQLKLQTAYGILLFFGAALGTSVVALIWSLITGQATVVFK